MHAFFCLSVCLPACTCACSFLRVLAHMALAAPRGGSSTSSFTRAGLLHRFFTFISFEAGLNIFHTGLPAAPAAVAVACWKGRARSTCSLLDSM